MAWLVWLVFVIGQLVHDAVQIWAIVSAPNSPALTWEDVFKSRWPALLARAFICTMIFWLWLDGQLVASLDAANIPLPGWLHTILNLSVSAPIAGLAGYVSDSLLAFIPWLKSSVPIFNYDRASTKQV